MQKTLRINNRSHHVNIESDKKQLLIIGEEMSNPFDLPHELIRQDKLDEAREILLDSLRMEIREAYSHDLNHAWYLVGDIFYREGDYTKAINAFEASIEKFPNDSAAMHAIANCYSELGKPDKSEEYLRNAMKFEESPGIIFNLGNALFDQEKYSEAIIFYRRISEKDSSLFKSAQNNIKISEEILSKK